MSPSAYNDVNIPPLMYGTAWKKDATTRLVELAVESGFTAIDTANQLIHYQESLVGDALQELEKRGIKRESLFLQTKFTPVNGQGGHTPYDAGASVTTQVKQSVESSFAHLHTDYLDSYVLHGPYSRSGLGAEDWEVWAAFEELYRSGKAKMIGISNVSADQLTQLCAKATVKPMVVQNRCYASAGWDQKVRQICTANSIIYQGFSLLTANTRVMTDRAVQDIAKRLGATVAQIIFRFSMKIGMLPLTGTTNPQHMREDLKSAEFDLSADEVKQIEGIELNH